MGLTGELVKSVFCNGRRSAAEKRRWRRGSVRIRTYLCGEDLEFDSVIAEEDSASVKSSEVTVTQPVASDVGAEEEGSEDVGGIEEEFRPLQPNKDSSMSKILSDEDAAVIIQSAFRQYRAARMKESRTSTSVDVDDESSVKMGSPSKTESISTSIEVQTGNSIEVVSVRDERLSAMSNRTLHKARFPQALKPKEDWDDSTVSSNVSRMRIQHKLEAMTRRERALAYAFSQQLRVFSKKRQMKALEEGTEPDMGWSWLERWMATRQSSILTTHGNQDFMVGKRLLDLAREEKESCGSNEVSVHLDSIRMTAAEDGDNSITSKNGIKTVPKNKALPRKQCQKVHAQVSKKDSAKEMGIRNDKKHKQKSMEGKNENKFEDAESQTVP